MAARTLNLRQIEIFRSVMTSGSMTAAAANLHVSQPLISQVLKGTEDQLGFKLFLRNRGRLQATTEAETLFAETVHLEAALERVQCAADALRRRCQGIVNLLVSPSIASCLLSPTLSTYRRQWPDIQVCCEPMGYRDMVTKLRRGDADIAVALGAEDEPGLDSLKVGRVRLVCAVPASHRLATLPTITPKDLLGEQLIAYSKESAVNRQIVSAFNEAHIDFAPTIHVPFGVTALELVRGGLGVAIVDALSAKSQGTGLALNRFAPARTLDAALLFTEDKNVSRHVSDFMLVLRNESRILFGWNRD